MTRRWGHAPKPFVLHHHGTHYRENHERLNRELRKLGKANQARTVVATLDLLQQGPGIPWAPAAHDLEAYARLRKRVPGAVVHIRRYTVRTNRKGWARVPLRDRDDVKVSAHGLIMGGSVGRCGLDDHDGPDSARFPGTNRL